MEDTKQSSGNEDKSSINTNSKPVEARVISEGKGLYWVKNSSGEYLAKITGKQIFKAESREDYPVVGDWVSVRVMDEKKAVIEKIQSRKSVLKRGAGDKTRRNFNNETQIIAANIDVAFIVVAVNRDFSVNRLERYLALVTDEGIEPVIIINKVDLAGERDLVKMAGEIGERMPGVRIFFTSMEKPESYHELRSSLQSGLTYCLLGSSGAGKSTIINNLIGKNLIKTGEISDRSGRGKHVTTRRDTYFLSNNIAIIDNPGMREVGLTDTSQGIDNINGEITRWAGKCKFIDCTHTHEPGCEIIKQLTAGKLNNEKYENYLKMKRETDYYELNSQQKREENKRWGKSISRAKKQLRYRKLGKYG